jgi:polyisoprenoid-binding protein YceI
MMSEVSEYTRHGGALLGVPPGRWQIDPAHTVLGFTVRHLMSKVRGRFNEFSGHIMIAEDRLQSAVQVEIALASVHTGNEVRDNHLRTNDFFDVEQHPTMTFASKGLREANGSLALDGELTIRDTTRAIQIDGDFLGFDPTGLQGEPRIGFEGRTSINRGDFGVSFGLAEGGKVVIGDRIDILLEVEAALTD